MMRYAVLKCSFRLCLLSKGYYNHYVSEGGFYFRHRVKEGENPNLLELDPLVEAV
jgi:hypothetical protein